MPTEYRKIVDEIYTALENLKAPPLLLGIIGSWGDIDRRGSACGLKVMECRSPAACLGSGPRRSLIQEWRGF
jgi:hypothetical protein